MQYLPFIGEAAAGIMMAGIYWLSMNRGATRLLRIGRIPALSSVMGGMLIRLLMIGFLFSLLAHWAGEIYLTIIISFVTCFTFLLMKKLFVFAKLKA